MLLVVLASALVTAHGPTALERLDALATAIEGAEVYAVALEHDPPMLVDEDRRALGAALGLVSERLEDVLQTDALAADDARSVWLALRAADRAADEWSAARKIGNARAMRAAARSVREALDRAQAIVSATEAACA